MFVIFKKDEFGSRESTRAAQEFAQVSGDTEQVDRETQRQTLGLRVRHVEYGKTQREILSKTCKFYFSSKYIPNLFVCCVFFLWSFWGLNNIS